MRRQFEPGMKPWDGILPDADSEPFDDAYAQLSPEQMQRLRTLHRVSWLIETGKEPADGALARSTDRIRQAFVQDGLDADWLLAQRRSIREQRIERSRRSELDGTSVELLGLVLPVAWSWQHGTTAFLLSPSLPNCSHMPPPSSHQVAHVEGIEPFDLVAEQRRQGASDLYVRVEGTLRCAVTSHLAHRVDGVMQIGASYAIEPTAITFVAPDQAAALTA